MKTTLKKLKLLLDEMNTYIPEWEKCNPEVSNATVGWQIEHILLTIEVILESVKSSDPAAYQYTFNKMRWWIFFTKNIPRGKAKAPKAILPSATISPEHLHKHIASVKEKLDWLLHLPKNSFFTHPYFGKLNIRQTFSFLWIHSHHHQKIIIDILK